MSSAEPPRRLDDEARRLLLRLAHDSIDAGLRTGAPLRIDPADYTGELGAERACFVTLRMSDKSLRGCIGSMEAVRILAADVAGNAWAAASQDPRFAPLRRDEYHELHVHISVLSPLEPLTVRSQRELLEGIRPGIDGLLVREGNRRGTLLPAVWEVLHDAGRFVFEVRRKAGLPGDYWSPTMTFHRYTAESFD
ncbi:MAG: AmmeMemoRadiSam system protein A [bacterium]|nr:AmmeMemoRadiSam system protein A [bacterium]